MAKNMLVDASHPEETRVVVASGNRVEEFDYESALKKQISGNIYLAKVTRVEPSLQAAFIDYGGNRHGFLAFNEIHPDYYQIPVEDRAALLEEEAEEDQEDARSDDNGADEGDAPSDDGDTIDYGNVETVGAEDAFEETARKKPRKRRYKIQEVIKRRQILLIQVVKEERGNKGAALTTYLSLAGRYCVLMPNTARGGGISRKIANPKDRKALKKIAGELDVPQGMGLIIRTAGSNRTKAEIKRDYEYLLRLWDIIRTNTLESEAPSLVYEEGSLIKRSIRDLYSKEIEKVLVQGEEAYRDAKDFMKMLMPSHAKNIQHYKESIPLFTRYRIESQLDNLLQPEVTLRSGGYIVMDQTEALVAVDVNSGKSTREHSIEETAHRTNLEAAEEVARQLRLRDFAGLIVIDFIDMEDNRNIRAVEKRLKDSLKTDRARIQVGRISPFGLLEMSRQRLRPALHEASSIPCKACQGTGSIRTVESLALHILRRAEEEGVQHQGVIISITAPVEVANFINNNKRQWIAQIEERYSAILKITGDAGFTLPHFELERRKADISDEAPGDMDETVAQEIAAFKEEGASQGKGRQQQQRRRKRRGSEDSSESESARPDARPAERETESRDAKSGDEEGKPRRRRRGRRGGRNRSKQDNAVAEEASSAPSEDGVIVESRETVAPAGDAGAADAVADTSGADTSGADTPEEKPATKRTRRRKPRAEAKSDAESSAPEAADETPAPEAEAPDDAAPADAAPENNGEDKPKKPRQRKPRAPAKTKAKPKASAKDEADNSDAAPAVPSEAGTEDPSVEISEPEVTAETPTAEPVKPARQGWWKSRFGVGQ